MAIGEQEEGGEKNSTPSERDLTSLVILLLLVLPPPFKPLHQLYPLLVRVYIYVYAYMYVCVEFERLMRTVVATSVINVPTTAGLDIPPKKTYKKERGNTSIAMNRMYTFAIQQAISHRESSITIHAHTLSLIG